MPTHRKAAEPARFVPGQPDMWAFVLFEALRLHRLLHRLRHLPDPESRPVSAVSGAPRPARRGLQYPRSAGQLLVRGTLRPGGPRTIVPSRVDECVPDHALRLRVPRLEGARVGEGDRQGVHVHHQRVLLLLLLPDGDPLPSPPDRLRLPRRSSSTSSGAPRGAPRSSSRRAPPTGTPSTSSGSSSSRCSTS